MRRDVTFSNAATRCGDREKKAGNAERLQKNILADWFCDAALSIIKLDW